MQLVSAVIRPEKLEQVRAALSARGLKGLTAHAVSGVGRTQGHRESYRGQNYTVDLLPKVKLELIVAEEMSELAIDAIVEAAYSGELGDGKIWVTPVETVVRIRTGERNESAI